MKKIIMTVCISFLLCIQGSQQKIADLDDEDDLGYEENFNSQKARTT